MHVQMKQHITGFRQGRPWPAKGGVLEVGDAEGARLVRAGYAVETEPPEPEEVDDETTGDDAGGGDADPPGQDGAPSDQPDGEASGEDAGGEWPRHVGGGNYELPDGTRVKGKDAAHEAYAAWLRG